MQSLQKLYSKGEETVGTHHKFIYQEHIWVVTPRVYNLIKERYLESDSPIKRTKRESKKQDYQVIDKKKRVTIGRSLELILAPEKYLIENNYKLVKQ